MKTLFSLLVFISIMMPSQAQTNPNAWTFRKQGEAILGKDPKTGKETVIMSDVNTETVEEGDTTTISDVYLVVSYVGPYITLLKEHYDFTTGSAHPNASREFVMINATTRQGVKLTEFYSADVIFNALRHDKAVMEALGDSNPKNLNELIEQTDGECEMKMGWNMIESFAFHHVEPGKVAIRIGLTNGCPTANGMFNQLGIFFPIPEKLKTLLPEAATKKTLMKDLLPKISSGW